MPKSLEIKESGSKQYRDWSRLASLQSRCFTVRFQQQMIVADGILWK